MTTLNATKGRKKAYLIWVQAQGAGSLGNT